MPGSAHGACFIRTRTEQTRRAAAMTNPEGTPVLSQVVDALLDRKAVDPVVLDLRGLTAATDYFVIVSGTSAAHVRGMADHLVTALAPAGVEPHHVGRAAPGGWGGPARLGFVVRAFQPPLLWFDLPAR